MKVLKKGRKQNNWAREYDCETEDGGCGARLLVEREDLYKTMTYTLGGTEGTYHLHFRCPECRCETNLFSGNSIPHPLARDILFISSKAQHPAWKGTP